ncbi:Slam-dependent surface lipoprotein [Halopseudomonas pelagia]|uniref:Slam-dependent surface lipoprotein n=1 Tax=Halopseudomonas pelagia TaxID=553151 RepID=UPI0030DD9A13
MKAIYLSVLATSLLSVSALSQADIVGTESYNTYVEVGESTVNAGPHNDELPGIGVYTIGLSDKVDFAGLSLYSSVSNGVYTLSAPIDVDEPDHSGMGVFNFAQVSGANVYFGEWSQTGTSSDSSRTVYYVGDDTGTSVPTSGTATYSVNGINEYSGSNLMSGTFTANFATNSLSGSLANSGLAVNIGSASFDSAGNISSSNASANGSAGVVTNGSVTGNFFGSDAAALAGIATFSNRDYDTAFGGTKD